MGLISSSSIYSYSVQSVSLILLSNYFFLFDMVYMIINSEDESFMNGDHGLEYANKGREERI